MSWSVLQKTSCKLLLRNMFSFICIYTRDSTQDQICMAQGDVSFDTLGTAADSMARTLSTVLDSLRFMNVKLATKKEHPPACQMSIDRHNVTKLLTSCDSRQTQECSRGQSAIFI